jgi:hypothetical protein
MRAKLSGCVFRAVSLFLVAAAAGCQGLTNGRMEWVQPNSTGPRAGNVYLVRGLIGVFSTGMDKLAAELNASGVRSHVYQDLQTSELADTIARQYASARNAEPLCLIGHSYGADDVLNIARVLEKRGIPVDMVVTVDATVPPPVPGNVRVCYNFYQSQLTDVIPMFRGIPLKVTPGSETELKNVDVRKNGRELLEPGTNHINIDKNAKVHKSIMEQVLATCPPREVWVARQLDNTAQPAAMTATPGTTASDDGLLVSAPGGSGSTNGDRGR